MMPALFAFVHFLIDAISLHLVRNWSRYLAILIALLVGAIIATLFMPAPSFPRGTVVEVPEDASFAETSALLEERGIIASAFVFKALARITGTDREVQAGRYAFPAPLGAAVVLYRLANGDSGIPTLRVTFPEGITVREMEEILTETMPLVDAAAFVREATPYEGYLFPDTYSFPEDATAHDIVERMRARFDEVWADIEGSVESDATLSQEGKARTVIMASLLEKETKVGEDRRIVSGILWDRIEIGMALQVDAVFGYIHGVDTYHPSGDDLEIDSPYNTYEYPDLPPGAIGNPGEDALRAALTPLDSPYLYYLADANGIIRYAEDFEGHKANKEQYLR